MLLFKQLAFGTVLAVVGTVSGLALAQDNRSPAVGTFEAPAADWLFVQSANGMAYEGDQLTLTGVSPQTIMFTDRPQRMAGDMNTEQFLKIWTEGKDSFEKDPPNATLAAVADGKEQIAVVELSSPKLDGDKLTYTVRVLEGTMPASGTSTSLFIDWWYGPFGGVCHHGPWGGARCFHPGPWRWW